MPTFKKQEQEEERSTISDIALDIGEVHFIEKDAKDEKAKLREEFFLGAALENQVSTLAHKTATVPDSIRAESEARAFVEQYNSGWRIIEGVEKDNGWVFTIEEDPMYKPYHIVVEVEDLLDSNGKPHPGYVVSKTIVSGGVMLDTERLKIDNHALYEEVTTFENYDILANMLYHANVDVEDINARLAQAGIPLVAKNPDDLTPEQNEAIKPYSYEGPKSLRLNVNYAKEEELGEASG